MTIMIQANWVPKNGIDPYQEGPMLARDYIS